MMYSLVPTLKLTVQPFDYSESPLRASLMGGQIHSAVQQRIRLHAFSGSGHALVHKERDCAS